MKSVIYSKKQLIGNRGRAISVRERVPEKDCETSIRKSYIYLTRRAEAVPDDVPVPFIRVIKAVDTKTQQEIFFLRVKGTVYFKKGRFVQQVDYLHSLVIRMDWKTHVLSSDPAALA